MPPALGGAAGKVAVTAYALVAALLASAQPIPPDTRAPTDVGIMHMCRTAPLGRKPNRHARQIFERCRLWLRNNGEKHE